MCANHRAIGDRRCFIYVDSQLSKNLRPAILLGPVAKPVVDALPVAEALGQITPLDARLRPEDHRIEKEPISTRGLAPWCSEGEQGLHSSPLRVGQRVPLHTQL
jgi:hypothetical protein